MIVSEIYQRREKDLNTLKTILVIGTSEYGFTNEIIEINSEEELIKTYGKKGSIYDSYTTIIDELDDSNVSILILKPYGSHATAYFDVNTRNEIVKDAICFKSIYSNEIYNQIGVNITPYGLHFIFPDNLNLENKVYQYKDYSTISKLIYAINEDTLNGLNVVIASSSTDDSIEYDETFMIVNDNKTLVGGRSDIDISDNMLKYKCLDVSYDLIYGLDIDYIVHTEIHSNDILYEPSGLESENSFYKQLLELCIDQLQFGIITIGVLTFDRVRYSNDVLAMDELYRLSIKYTTSVEYEKLKFLMVTIYDYLKFNYSSELVNPALYVALKIAKCRQISNVIDKPFDKSISINNYLENDDYAKLNNYGVMAFRHSPYYDCVVVANGVTNYVYNKSTQYKYLTTVNMLQNILPKIKTIFEKYLGESIYELEHKRILDDEILNMLNRQSKIGNIDKHEFIINYDIENGNILYELYVKNIYMTESIKYIGNLS